MVFSGLGSAPPRTRSGAAQRRPVRSTRRAETKRLPGFWSARPPGCAQRTRVPGRGGGACGRAAAPTHPALPAPRLRRGPEGTGLASVSVGDARRAEPQPEDATRAQFRRGGRASDSDGGGVGAASCGEAAGAPGHERRPEEAIEIFEETLRPAHYSRHSCGKSCVILCIIQLYPSPLQSERLYSKVKTMGSRSEGNQTQGHILCGFIDMKCLE